MRQTGQRRSKAISPLLPAGVESAFAQEKQGPSVLPCPALCYQARAPPLCSGQLRPLFVSFSVSSSSTSSSSFSYFMLHTSSSSLKSLLCFVCSLQQKKNNKMLGWRIYERRRMMFPVYGGECARMRKQGTKEKKKKKLYFFSRSRSS